MGVSSECIFGYGAVISIEIFVRMFPRTFIQRNGKWIPHLVDKLHNEYVKFLYNDDHLSHVFVTTTATYDYGFEKGYPWDAYTMVNLDNINEYAEVVGPWLQEIVPDIRVGYIMFGKVN